ncbi:MAG: Mur ligase family protein, partial [Tenacibaculum sp.]
MKNLKDILYKVAVNAVYGNTNVDINTIQFDSRQIQYNDVFVAQKGVTVDGHLFIDKALALGASVIICEEIPSELKDDITYIQVQDSNIALAIMSANFYDNPSKNLQLVGVTGTNGKTTIASLLYQLFKKAGYKVGLLSTVKIMVDETEFKATHTTPDSVTINQYLDKMIDESVEYCFMEVSS